MEFDFTAHYNSTTAVYCAMSIARRPGDFVKAEYQVDPVARGSSIKLSPALDVVYIASETGKQKQVL